MNAAPQIPLQLDPDVSRQLDSFADPRDGEVHALIAQFIDAKAQTALITGPAGCGKSHLLTATCHAVTQQGRTAWLLAADEAVPQAAAVDLLAIDNLELAIGNPARERALFNLFNAQRAAGGQWLGAIAGALDQYVFSLPDFRSRLAWGLRLALPAVTDEQRVALLVQQASAMGFELGERAVTYMLRHGPRQPRQLVNWLQAAARLSLARKQRLSVPMLRDTLSA